MMKIVIVLLSVILVTRGNPIKDENCYISTDHKNGDLTGPEPLILTDTSDPEFIWPDWNQTISIPKDTSILLACPGRNNNLKNFGTEWITAKCLGEKKFLVNSEAREISDFTCKISPSEIIKKTGISCLNNHQRYDIGYSVRNEFKPLIEICRDDKTFETFYSKYTIVKEIGNHQLHVTRPSWKRGSYHPTFVNSMYKKKDQISTLRLLLNSEELANKYITKQQFFQRGHLAPKADFIYGSHQKATFWILNTAPQWGTFNSGNWAILERAVRNFAIEHKMDLTVYTGVHGQTTLLDVNGTEVPLYLYANETHREIPIPRFFWKIIQDPVSKQGVAFVGLNEPYAKNITSDMYLCPNIGDDPAFSWLNWKPEDIEHGVSYVCSIDELKKTVPTVPDELEDYGVLTGV